MQVSEKTKDHRLEKKQVKNPHQRSPYAMKIEDRSHEETERDNSDAPEARHGTLPNKNNIKENDNNYILLARRRMGRPDCGNTRARGKSLW